MFIVAKLKKIDTLKISKFYQFHFCVFKVIQCIALGATVDNCLCFFFCKKSILPTDSITIVDVRLCRGFSAVNTITKFGGVPHIQGHILFFNQASPPLKRNIYFNICNVY